MNDIETKLGLFDIRRLSAADLIEVFKERMTSQEKYFRNQMEQLITRVTDLEKHKHFHKADPSEVIPK